MAEMVDIFIPAIPNNSLKLPAALCSALTQTYSPVRVILFLDCWPHKRWDEILLAWWYTPKDDPRPPMKEIKYERMNKPLLFQECERGMLVCNPNGPCGSAGRTRQWLFDWEGKSSWVKMLDSDDILTPAAIELMMRHTGKDVDGVFCPMIKCSSYRYAGIMSGEPKRGHSGSGSMMFSKGCMEEIVRRGFTWDTRPGHDGAFLDFIQESDFNIKTIPENVIYLYLK